MNILATTRNTKATFRRLDLHGKGHHGTKGTQGTRIKATKADVQRRRI
ncbi:MAG TPA: hypothetical protein VIM51_12230 [Desulfosporosinus sp.]